MVAVTVKDQPPAEGYGHTLLIRRSVADPSEIEFFLAHAPDPTPIPELIAVAGMRWKIEENNAQGKDLLGLDQYQVRKWTPWHRHVTACMLAHAFLAATRASLGKHAPAPGGAGPLTPPPLIRPSLAEIRRLLARTLLAAARGIDHVLHWSLFRRLHQTRALISHYRRRGDPLPAELRM